MQIIRTIKEFGDIERSGQVMGFVPTMGALHEGHISLVRRCKQECDITVVSIFVNPTQFNNPIDLKRYPRTEDEDLRMLQEVGADYVFMPSADEVYPKPDYRQFSFGALEDVMEGRHRPGHFNGVAQVVSRFFSILQPDKSYFGEKDYQQLAVIRQMVKDLEMKVEIVGCDIVREKDGLAMSSRNKLLSPEQREAAVEIYKALIATTNMDGTIQEREIFATDKINANSYLNVEYVTIAASDTLQAPTTDSDNCRIFVAVQCGDVRLIDNMPIEKCK